MTLSSPEALLSATSQSAIDKHENAELEELLIKAVSEPAYRPDFFRVLLESTVFVPGSAELAEHTEEHALALSSTSMPYETVSLQHWKREDGHSVIPFFTSVDMLQQALTEAQPQPFIALPVRELFEMTQGESLFLNPHADYGKEFFPEEIEKLLTVGILPSADVTELDGEFPVRLMQPTHYPTEIVNALITFFSRRKPVRRAWVVQMHDLKHDAEPNLLFALQLDASEDEIESLIQDAGSVASEWLTDENSTIDFCLVQENGCQISHYFLQHSEPFYQRKWGGWLRNAIPTTVSLPK